MPQMIHTDQRRTKAPGDLPRAAGGRPFPDTFATSTNAGAALSLPSSSVPATGGDGLSMPGRSIRGIGAGGEASEGRPGFQPDTTMLTEFRFQTQEIRIQEQDGEPWFVAADVCRVLDIGNPSQALARLDDDDRMTLTTNECHSGQRGGAQSLNLVSESGLYNLIFTSRKPEAKQFKRWVTSEVLPAIRKTGQYQHPAKVDVGALIPKDFASALELAAATVRQLEAARETIAEQAPKVEVHDRLVESEGVFGIRQVAAMVAMTQTKLVEWLMEKGFIYRAPDKKLQAYAEQVTAGYFVDKMHVYHDDKRDADVTTCNLKITPAGAAFIARKLGKEPQQEAMLFAVA